MKEDPLAAPLTLSASQSFCIDWLMPRLSLLAEQTDIAPDLVVKTGTPALALGEADLAIVGYEGDPPDFPSDRLCELDGVIAAAPRLNDGRRRPASVADVGGHNILSLRTPPHLWRRWLEDVGHPEVRLGAQRQFDSSHLMYEAAANGLGVVLATSVSSERQMADGRLTACTPERRAIGMNYSLVYRTRAVSRRAEVVRLAEWLHAEMAQSHRRFLERTNIPVEPQPLRA
jgi:LysR family glycine cleavage system transcriptional activator